VVKNPVKIESFQMAPEIKFSFGKCQQNVAESGMPLYKAEGVTFAKQGNGKVYLDVGSGTYRFASRFQNL
jgi:hypothetical protein